MPIVSELTGCIPQVELVTSKQAKVWVGDSEMGYKQYQRNYTHAY